MSTTTEKKQLAKLMTLGMNLHLGQRSSAELLEIKQALMMEGLQLTELEKKRAKAFVGHIDEMLQIR